MGDQALCIVRKSRFPKDGLQFIRNCDTKGGTSQAESSDFGHYVNDMAAIARQMTLPIANYELVSEMTHRTVFQVSLSTGCLALAAGLACGSDGYSPPSNYYAAVSFDGTPESLRNSLNSIIRGHTVRSYGAARQALAITDADPDQPGNILLTYTGASVSGSWDSGATWNREHTWPRSLGVGDNGADFSDLHALRPCNPSLNSSRGNKPFGLASSAYWDPTRPGASLDYRGEMARAMFYMAVRYDGTESATVNLQLKEGFSATNQMGDLSYLLEWHYEETPATHERRRNHLIYSFADNPNYAQGNRNPFVDHPEFVWAIWGDEANNSQIAIDGSTVDPDGGSLLGFDLGKFVRSDSVDDAPGFTVAINKSGSTPTTYTVWASGDAFSAEHGIPSTVGRNTQQVELDVTLWSAAPGLLSGQLLIDNTDLTSAGSGLGNDDADDFVFFTGDAVNPAAASFDSLSGDTEQTIDLGVIQRSTSSKSTIVPLYNAGGNAQLTADLIVTSVTAAGSTNAISLSGYPAGPIAGGAFDVIDLALETGGPLGSYEAVYTFETADEDLPGAEDRETLTLTVAFELEQNPCFGNLDGDGMVGLDDLDLVLANFGTTGGATLASGDASGDGAVDLDDLDIVLSAFGNPCP